MSNLTIRLYSVLIASIWGGTFVLIKIGGVGFSPVNLAILRFAVAAAVFLPLFLLGLIPFKAIRRQDLPAFGALLLTLLCGQFLLNFVLKYIPASVGSIVAQTAPAITLLLSIVFRVERLQWRILLGVAVAFAGTSIVILASTGNPNSDTHIFALVLAVLVPVAIALYNFVGKPLVEKYGSANLAGQLVVATGVVLAALIPLRGSVVQEMMNAPLSAWISVLGLALPCTVLSYILWSLLLKHLTRTQVASLMYLVPVFSVGMAVIFLQETVGKFFLLGTAGVLAGLWMIERSSNGTRGTDSHRK